MSAVFHASLARTTIENRSKDFIPDWANQFYQSKKVEGISAFTLKFYKQQLGHFLKFCEPQYISCFDDVTPNTIRQFLLWHEETGHNPGGLHAALGCYVLFFYGMKTKPSLKVGEILFID